MKVLIVPILCASALLSAEPEHRAVPNRDPLAPDVFYSLPLTSIEPRGWLLGQLRIQANGLTGHLDEFWPDVGANSGWLGGKGESWERGPYYLDGLVPLAYLLKDPVLIGKARKWVNWTLEHQRPDGSIGPESNKDWWPNMVMLKVLTQYQEATGDPRVIPVLEKYFDYQARTLQENPLQKWAIYRWGDELLSILWLYDRNGDAKLLDLARNLAQQGYDWKPQFANFTYTGKVTKPEANMKTHGVNNAMALKTAVLYSLVSGNPDDRKAVYEMLEKLDRYHLLPSGVHSADEHYAGLDPSQGTELCAVVEAMFSLETIIPILGDAALADRLERIAFNALPGTLSPDMWSHQYDQQPNQVLVNQFPRDWSTNGPDSNLFGLEPNFGCCTANLHQGWPKFTESLWMATRDGGLAAVAYAPSLVKTTVQDAHVSILEDTEYPFREHVQLTVATDKPVTFPLKLRVPRWTNSPAISINGFAQRKIQPGSFYEIAREWKSGDVVQISFEMPIIVSHAFHDGVTVYRGPLIYSLRIGEKWKKLRAKGMTADWEIDPTTAWNFGLDLHPRDPQSSFSVDVRPLRGNPFTPDGAPVRLHVRGRRIADWKLVDGSAGPLPQSPVKSKGADEELTLVPYGSTRLRITAFPVIAH